MYYLFIIRFMIRFMICFSIYKLKIEKPTKYINLNKYLILIFIINN